MSKAINTENQILIDKLRIVHRYKVKTGANKFSQLAVLKAINAIKSTPDTIITYQQAKKINGIGDKIAGKIRDIRCGVQLEEEKEMGDTIDEETKHMNAIDDLKRVHGIGNSHAERLIRDFNIYSVKDLIKAYKQKKIRVAKNELTRANVIYLKYFDDLEMKIPRDEITSFKKILKTMIGKISNEIIEQEIYITTFDDTRGKMVKEKITRPFKFKIAGSYRRGRAMSGDIDVLISHPQLKREIDVKSFEINGKPMLTHIIDMLDEQELLVDDLTFDGNTKYMGICIIDKLCRRLDVEFICYESWGTALLYFTGSAKFNINTRIMCNKLGYTLNEHGLYEFDNVKKIKGRKIPIKSEKQFFTFMKMNYVSPRERDIV